MVSCCHDSLGVAGFPFSKLYFFFPGYGCYLFEKNDQATLVSYSGYPPAGNEAKGKASDRGGPKRPVNVEIPLCKIRGGPTRQNGSNIINAAMTSSRLSSFRPLSGGCRKGVKANLGFVIRVSASLSGVQLVGLNGRCDWYITCEEAPICWKRSVQMWTFHGNIIGARIGGKVPGGELTFSHSWFPPLPYCHQRATAARSRFVIGTRSQIKIVRARDRKTEAIPVNSNGDGGDGDQQTYLPYIPGSSAGPLADRHTQTRPILAGLKRCDRFQSDSLLAQ